MKETYAVILYNVHSVFMFIFIFKYCEVTIKPIINLNLKIGRVHFPNAPFQLQCDKFRLLFIIQKRMFD